MYERDFGVYRLKGNKRFDVLDWILDHIAHCAVQDDGVIVKIIAIAFVVFGLGPATIVRASTPQELAARIRSDTKTWAEVIKSAGIKAE